MDAVCQVFESMRNALQPPADSPVIATMSKMGMGLTAGATGQFVAVPADLVKVSPSLPAKAPRAWLASQAVAIDAADQPHNGMQVRMQADGRLVAAGKLSKPRYKVRTIDFNNPPNPDLCGEQARQHTAVMARLSHPWSPHAAGRGRRAAQDNSPGRWGAGTVERRYARHSGAELSHLYTFNVMPSTRPSNGVTGADGHVYCVFSDKLCLGCGCVASGQRLQISAS